ncbi:MAG: helix-turn-helix domain-containing protein, partial [Pseudomonadota bacterium]
MSIEAMNWAWKLHLKPVHKLILMRYADYANENHEAWPSHRRVARDCNCSVPTVRRVLKALVAIPIIKVDERRGTVNRVRLLVGKELPYPDQIDQGRYVKIIHNRDQIDQGRGEPGSGDPYQNDQGSDHQMIRGSDHP